MLRRTPLAALLLLVLLPLAACDRPPETSQAPQAKAPDSPRVVVFAAASTANAMTDLVHRYQAGHAQVIDCSFAASSTLARQIEAGAPADVYLSADQQWMDYLQQRRLIDPATRVNLLGNELVLAAPRSHPFQVRWQNDFDLAAAFTGKLAMGDPSHVPAGIYGRQALEHLGWWQRLQSRIAPAEDVRAALRYLQTGAADAAIVYRTDAGAADDVAIVGVFPPTTHDPIVYPAAATVHAGAAGRQFLEFLQSPEASQVFQHAGFKVKPVS